jgi:outer membrane lipoprotein-sorting protein
MKKLMVVAGILGVLLSSLFTDVYALELSADFVMKNGNHTEEGSIAIKGEKYMMQSKNKPSYSILRGDKKVSWMIIPVEKSYMEMPFDPSKQKVISEKLENEVSRKLVGTETVSGFSTKKYEVTVKNSGIEEKIYQWVATEINFPVRFSSLDGKMFMEYRNIKSSADDSVFELPKGYENISVPLPPGFPDIPDDEQVLKKK